MKFENKTFIDLTNPEHVTAQKEAIEKVRKTLGQTLEVGKKGSKPIRSVNPFKPDQLIVEMTGMSKDEVLTCVDRADKAFAEWSTTSVENRQAVMERIADALEAQRYELNAVMMFEVGKTWIEADADTCETIDFVRYYAESLSDWVTNDNLIRISGQTNELRYIPLGVGSVIAPWNFPLAILCGMTTAALVTGNTVLMKPSSDSILIAHRLHTILMEAGVPKDVVQLVVGRGGEVGDTMVQHPRVRFISFTGSREVGTHINQEGAKVHDNQIWLKRMVLEMGGKDGIFVDETANLDDAAKAVVGAAFGYSGQKCSACSRLIVHQDVKDELVEKVVKLTAGLKLGDPTDVATQMSPVINKASFEKVQQYIEIGRKEGQVLAGGNPCEDMGFTWEPTIVDGIKETDRLFQDEIFGPVLAITVAKDFDDGIRLMNATAYGLTGSVYTNDANRKVRACNEVHVGNFYINRKCTGAMVGQHPFGGFNMSGTDSKAGGPDYLGQFLQPKAIAELV